MKAPEEQVRPVSWMSAVPTSGVGWSLRAGHLVNCLIRLRRMGPWAMYCVVAGAEVSCFRRWMAPGGSESRVGAAVASSACL